MAKWFWIVSDTGFVLDVAGINSAAGATVHLFFLKSPDEYIWLKVVSDIIFIPLYKDPMNDPHLEMQPRRPNEKFQHWTYDDNSCTLNSALQNYVLTVKKSVLRGGLGCKHLDTLVPKTQRFTFVPCEWPEYRD
ncbi:7831_t:CDS:2 [Ambispora leptoticha]|uniref:7831_t:CDS:1 n=1 Tax=Ambispora leptoticha TaxID=144679 RepID=A0A9N9F7Y8_9GLOM|nr:7831_t:CDS:2 [Ambispora leptoticha]